MASEMTIEPQTAAQLSSSHPLQMTSRHNDVINELNGGERSLRDELDEAYLKEQEDITKEIEELKDRDRNLGINVLGNGSGMVENVDGCDNCIGGDGNSVISDLDQKQKRLELRRKKADNPDMWASTLRKVNINCDRQSVKYTNSGDFSPEGDVPKSVDDVTSPTGDTEQSEVDAPDSVVSPSDAGDNSGSTAQLDSSTQGGSRGRRPKIPLIFAHRRRRRRHSVDEDTLVIDPDEPPKTHLENFNYVMGESACTLTVLDVADALHNRYAYVSGGKSRSGSPILTFPDNPGVAEVPETAYRHVVNYLTSIPASVTSSLQDVDLGFMLIVDRRQCGWGAVKTMLLRISGFFPGLVHEVLVLRPAGFFARTFTDMGFKFVKDDFKFPVIMCSSVEELHEYVDRSQLPEDLGGTIVFDHREWIQQRAAIEKFSANTSSIGHTLRSLCQRFAETEFPNDVGATEELILEHEAERKVVKEDLDSTIKHGEVLLKCFKCMRNEDGSESELSSNQLPPSKLNHVTAVERLLVQLEETGRNFDEFWSNHELRLGQCLELRKFEEDFKQLQYSVERHLAMMTAMTNDTGDTVQRVETLIKELQDYENESAEDVGKGESLQQMGQKLIDDDHYAVDCIRPKCIELQRMCEQYKELVRRRYEILQKSRDLHDRIEKANKWCTAGVDLLATQALDRCQTPEGADVALRDIEQFMGGSADIRLSDPKEFRAAFESVITPQTKTVVHSVLQRIEDVQEMCEKRRNSLKRLTAKSNRPVQTVNPEPHVIVSPGKPPPVSPSGDYNRKRRKSLPASSPNHKGHERSGSGNRLQRMRTDVTGSDTGSTTGNSIDLDNELGDSELLAAKRGHVMRELIDTERMYVQEIKTILEGYCDEMDNPYMQQLLPVALKGKKDTLFGNLRELYDFHSNIFLKDLENCRETPGQVGLCFVARKEEFQMYSFYCQNKPQSEALRRDVGDNNAFFKECQKRLDHRLPLGAYLLKPVQRITKYQLLLKEMLKYTGVGEGSAQLQQAVDTMLGVLKYVNDIMHQIAITGFNGRLEEQGRLLMQGAFNVWCASKKETIRGLRFKPMQRHVFLYEKKIILCKKKDDPASIERASYIYKNSIETKDIGLTETVKGDKRKFELWSHGRTEVFTFQAGSEAVKETWVEQVKKVLMSQFDVIKGQRRKEIPVKPIAGASETTGSFIISPQQQQSFDSAAINNNNFGLITPTIANPAMSAAPGGDIDSALTSPQGEGHLDQYSDEAGWSSEEWDDDSSNNTNVQDQILHQVTDADYEEYVVLADYQPMDSNELPLTEGDLVELRKVGSEGWWYVRHTVTGEEGWSPASYLESTKRRSSHSTVSMSSLGKSQEESLV